MESKTLVLQSHREPLPHDWLIKCCDSVKRWCKFHEYDYLWVGDELFDYIPIQLRTKTQSQPVVASDLARLLLLQDYLGQRYDCVIWCDADTLVFKPDSFVVSKHAFELGREIWVQRVKTSKKPKTHVKVHNAYMMFRQSNTFLGFYIDSCLRLLERHPGPFVSQFIGPKFLTAIHNIVACPVNESAGVLSPLVIMDYLNGGGVFLEAFKNRSQILPAAVNLCASSVTNGDLSDNDMMHVCKLLEQQMTL